MNTKHATQINLIIVADKIPLSDRRSSQSVLTDRRQMN